MKVLVEEKIEKGQRKRTDRRELALGMNKGNKVGEEGKENMTRK